MLLQPASPIRQPGDIDGAIERLRAEGADSLFSACPQRGFVWRASDAGIASLTYDFREQRGRQELDEEDWRENGSFYVFRPWVLDELDNRLGGTVTIWPMHPLDSFQIDEADDTELLNILVALRSPPAASLAMERVRLLCFDFDGVLTDNRVLVDEHGTEAVFCDRSDGWGIARVRALGIPVVISRPNRHAASCGSDAAPRRSPTTSASSAAARSSTRRTGERTDRSTCSARGCSTSSTIASGAR